MAQGESAEQGEVWILQEWTMWKVNLQVKPDIQENLSGKEGSGAARSQMGSSDTQKTHTGGRSKAWASHPEEMH